MVIRLSDPVEHPTSAASSSTLRWSRWGRPRTNAWAAPRRPDPNPAARSGADGLLCAGEDLDLARLDGLRDGDRETQHAIGEVGADSVHVQVLAQRQMPGELTVRSLGQQPVALSGFWPSGCHGQYVMVGRDVDRVG